MKDMGVKYSYALNDRQERVSIQNAERGKTYTCQLCGSKMVPKKGNIKRWHYAHTMDVGCDVWYRNKGEWHIEMQEKFDEDCREVVVTTEDGEKHIADVCIEKPCGQKLVIEFQNSPMTAEEFKERTNFWKNKVGADIIWVFNFKQDDSKSQNRFQEIPDGRILREYAEKNYKYYRWKNPSIPFSDLKHDILAGRDYADIIRSVPAFIESVPIILYMNAEEKTEWKKYERYKTSSITGRFNETPFYLKLCGISPIGMTQDINQTYETHLNGYDLIYGEKYGYSWFKTYIERERYPMMVSGKFCELEEIPLEKKALEYIEVLEWIYSKVIKEKITNEQLKEIQHRLDKAKREYRDTGNPKIKGIHEYELKIAGYYRKIEQFSPEIFAAIVTGGQTKTSTN